MKYNEASNQTDENVKKLGCLYEKWKQGQKRAQTPNIWSIIEYGRESYEIRYSRFFRWLLDPKETHGLKSDFTKMLWDKMGKDEVDWDIATAKTEHYLLAKDEGKLNNDDKENGDGSKGRKRFIDILALGFDDESKIKCNKCEDKCDNRITVNHKDVCPKDCTKCIMIELKVWSPASDGQLENYADYIDNKLNLDGNDKLYVFITPEGDLPKEDDKKDNKDRWKPMGYAAICDILAELLSKVSKREVENKEKTIALIEDFNEELKDKIALIPFAENAKELCKELIAATKNEEIIVEYDEDGNKEKGIESKRRHLRNNLKQIIVDECKAIDLSEEFLDAIMEHARFVDQTPSEQGVELVRKLFNDLVKENKRVPEDTSRIPKLKRIVKNQSDSESDIEYKFQNGELVAVELTGKQGIYLYFEEYCEKDLKKGIKIRMATHGKEKDEGTVDYFPGNRGAVFFDGEVYCGVDEKDKHLVQDEYISTADFLEHYEEEKKKLFEEIEKKLASIKKLPHKQKVNKPCSTNEPYHPHM